MSTTVDAKNPAGRPTANDNKIVDGSNNKKATQNILDPTAKRKLSAAIMNFLTGVYKTNKNTPLAGDKQNSLKTELNEFLKVFFSKLEQASLDGLAEKINKGDPATINRLAAELLADDNTTTTFFKGNKSSLSDKITRFLKQRLSGLQKFISDKEAATNAAAAERKQDIIDTKSAIEQKNTALLALFEKSSNLTKNNGAIALMSKMYSALLGVNLEYGEGAKLYTKDLPIRDEDMQPAGKMLQEFAAFLKKSPTDPRIATMLAIINADLKETFFAKKALHISDFGSMTKPDSIAMIDAIRFLYKRTGTLNPETIKFLQKKIKAKFPNLSPEITEQDIKNLLDGTGKKEHILKIKETIDLLLPAGVKPPVALTSLTHEDLLRLFKLTETDAKKDAKTFAKAAMGIASSTMDELQIRSALFKALLIDNIAEKDKLMKSKNPQVSPDTDNITNPTQVSDEFDGEIPRMMAALHVLIDKYKDLLPSDKLYQKTGYFSFTGGDSTFDAFRKENQVANGNRQASLVKSESLAKIQRSINDIKSKLKQAMDPFNSTALDDRSLFTQFNAKQIALMNKISILEDGETIGDLFGDDGEITKTTKISVQKGQSILNMLDTKGKIISDKMQQETTSMQQATQESNQAVESLMRFIQKMFDAYRVLLQ